VTDVVNVFEVEPEYRDDAPPAYARGGVQIGPLVGGGLLGASVYELPSGVSTCPYHYEYGREEWLVVLEGRPTLRTPGGERDLDVGDTVCFPEGPAGAHKVTNAGAETARVTIFSTKGMPVVFVYPDSDKIAIGTANPADYVMVRRSAQVDYFDGEV
jgi:uncharacterized cupin superfamily protein